MLRAVVVDDSPTVRSLLKAILGRDPEIEVVGVAGDGLEAVEVVKQLRPDVVTMDIQMPRMNGFEATKEIMIAAPTPIVIVTGSTMMREVQTTMNALRAGALTVLMKPPGPESPLFDAATQELVATVKAMANVKLVRHARAARPAKHAAGKKRTATSPMVVAIAASTGGPQAIEFLLAQLPRDFPAPILIVQHISLGFTAGLATWLSTTARLRVKLAEANEPLLPSTVYLAPEQRHLGISDGHAILLSEDPPIEGFRPSATFMFESVGRVCGNAAIGVMLTGMGRDGVEGLRPLRQHGGTVLAQDEASCVVYGMPGAAAQAGVVSQILPLEKIASKLQEIVKSERR